jgi:XRE family transcriptional regulator, regulator of sulfur utilization
METELSRKLKHYRRIQNLSQEGLAQASGLSIRTIQRIEKGESVGSAYTLKTLANALHISASDLVFEEVIPPATDNSHNIHHLKLLNLSALSIILIPLANIILPTIIYLRNRNDDQVNRQGRKIISFQILWTVCTLSMMIIIPLILLSFQAVKGSSIPMSVPVYFVCVALNIYYTIRFAICLNNREPFLNRIPNML